MAESLQAARSERQHFFVETIFGEPAWDLLLDLYVAGADRRRESIRSARLTSSVARTTASRRLMKLVESGLVIRMPAPLDRRSSRVVLTDGTAAAMAT